MRKINKNISDLKLSEDFISKLNKIYNEIEKNSKNANYIIPTKANIKFLKMLNMDFQKLEDILNFRKTD